ncbi:hypothetical protein [uncultured Lentibacter sp.]|uniref:hypothetical protein n=1 Tax=uncultured Lentibacter sp. TaxID=1659309 RepID=UPI002623A5BE|nr:hypothetical protein [uncultured Lentibacter sp.]
MRYVIVLGLMLMACDTPSREFRGSPAQRVTVGPSVFDVRVVQGRAEALRVNSEWAPRLAAVEPRARVAIEAVSGCKVVRLRGDQAMMVADLKCEGAAPPPAPRETVYCSLEGAPYEASGSVIVDVRCD